MYKHKHVHVYQSIFMILGATVLTARIRSACYIFLTQSRIITLSYNSKTRDEKTRVRKSTKHFALLKSFESAGRVHDTFEPVLVRYQKLECTYSEYSDPPAHPHSLIRVLVFRLRKLSVERPSNTLIRLRGCKRLF